MDDESVSKLNSMSGTLQCMACVSPVCERRVMSVFASAVGQGHLHIDVVSKVCVCVCASVYGVCKLIPVLLIPSGDWSYCCVPWLLICSEIP